jgi:hypothetical protein
MASDKSLIVLMGATQQRGTMPLYLSQLAAAGIEYAVVDCSDKPNINGGGNLGYRVKKFRELASQYSQYERLVISDAFDVTFYGDLDEVISKIPLDKLLHAGEKNAYPSEVSSLPIPDVGSPHRYVNGGLVAGTPEHFLHWCTYTERHRLYSPDVLDQYFLNLEWSEGVGCLPDYKTDLFFCLYGGYPELEFERGAPVNTQFGTHPCFLHACGGWDTCEMFEKHRRSIL